MRFTSLAIVLLCVFFTFSFSNAENAEVSYFRAVKKINAELKKETGLSIKEINILMGEGTSSFQPKWALEQSGELAVLKALEADGFLKLKISKGLPDGQEPSQEFVSYAATDKGLMLIAAIHSADRVNGK